MNIRTEGIQKTWTSWYLCKYNWHTRCLWIIDTTQSVW